MNHRNESGLPPNVGPSDRVVLFDGVCNLCAAWARFLIRHDRERAFKLGSIQSPEGQAILKWLGISMNESQTMVVVEGGNGYTKSSAFVQVMRGLPFPWRMISVLRLVPRWMRDWVYDRIARNRYTLFGKRDVCLLPTPDHASRFLRAEPGGT